MLCYYCLEIEQSLARIKIHLDNYIQEAIDDYKSHFKKLVKSKKVPMQPGVVLDNKGSRAKAAEGLSVNYSQALIRFIVGEVRYFNRNLTAGTVLCIRGAVALGCAPTPHGISRRKQELQAVLTHRRQDWAGRLLRLRLGK